MLMRRANRLDRSLVARRLQPGWIGHLTVTALLLTVRLPVAAQSRPKEDLPVSLAAEIKQLRDLVLDQVKAIEALRAQVAEQQAKIEALQGPAEGKNALPPALMTSLPTAPGSPARPNEKKRRPAPRHRHCSRQVKPSRRHPLLAGNGLKNTRFAATRSFATTVC